jgi:hypothetical protein
VFYNRDKKTECSAATEEVKKQEYPTTGELKKWERSTTEDSSGRGSRDGVRQQHDNPDARLNTLSG